MEHLRTRPGVGFVSDGKEWSEEDVASLLFPHHTEFWIADLMEAQLFHFTYREACEIPAKVLDKIRLIQGVRADLRKDGDQRN